MYRFWDYYSGILGNIKSVGVLDCSEGKFKVLGRRKL